MQLTLRTDYALRLLIYLAGIENQRVKIAQVADVHCISRNHLMKIVNDLAHAGLVNAVRGRGGGIRLGCDPADINLGEVIRLMEPDCPLVDCTVCRPRARCNLLRILDEALGAFNATLAEYSLADLSVEISAEPDLDRNG